MNIFILCSTYFSVILLSHKARGERAYRDSAENSFQSESRLHCFHFRKGEISLIERKILFLSVKCEKCLAFRVDYIVRLSANERKAGNFFL